MQLFLPCPILFAMTNTDTIFFPDLNDDDFRRLIAVRKIVVIKFWSDDKGQKDADHSAFPDAAEMHPEVAFAQANVDEHQSLALRAGALKTPSIQIWVEGTLLVNEEGEFSAKQIDQMVERAKKDSPRE